MLGYAIEVQHAEIDTSVGGRRRNNARWLHQFGTSEFLPFAGLAAHDASHSGCFGSVACRSYDRSVLRAVGRAFVGEGELTERQGAVLVAGSGVAFSVTAIAFRGVERASDYQFLTYRGLSTVLVMVVLIMVRRSKRPVSFAGASWRTWVAALVLASTSMLYILALSRTSAATTLFLLAAAPVFAAIIGWVLLREHVERSTMIAIAITAVGVTIMVSEGLDAGSTLGLFFAAAATNEYRRESDTVATFIKESGLLITPSLNLTISASELLELHEEWWKENDAQGTLREHYTKVTKHLRNEGCNSKNTKVNNNQQKVWHGVGQRA